MEDRGKITQHPIRKFYYSMRWVVFDVMEMGFPATFQSSDTSPLIVSEFTTFLTGMWAYSQD